MGKRERPLADREMIKALVKTAVDAAAQQRFFEASVILFQTVEGLLRIAVKVFGKAHGIRAEVLEKCADTETSFWRLVLHYDMIQPDNGLADRLLALNARRNKIMHRLFCDFASMEHLHSEMAAFCKEAMSLNIALQKDLGLSG